MKRTVSILVLFWFCLTAEAQNKYFEIFTDSAALKKFGWNHNINICTAYLTGFLAGSVVRKKGVDFGVLDIGNNIHSKGGRIYAALKGVVDAGLSVAHDPSVFPSEDRLAGKHIGDKIFAEMNSVKEKIAQEGK